eukprot:3210445-Amphidinium_carterae.1
MQQSSLLSIFAQRRPEAEPPGTSPPRCPGFHAPHERKLHEFNARNVRHDEDSFTSATTSKLPSFHAAENNNLSYARCTHMQQKLSLAA